MKSNITDFIKNKLNMKLHNQQNHPIEIMKNHVYNYFNSLDKYKFKIFDNLEPVVSIEDNFDKLLIPPNHPARSTSDTYYVDETHVLRTHTSAHQNQLLSEGHTSFLVTGDVYRKDEIDSKHYPIFHQMEMLTFVEGDPVTELKSIISGLVEYLFPNCKYRFNSDYFPFTDPSFETEVEFEGNWLEILGCGVVHQDILKNNNIHNKTAIAVGFGLDRLTMIFTEIPDIRYLWSTHNRFLDQYADGKLNKFKKYSTIPDQAKDISFYVNNSFKENDLMESIRVFSEDVKEVKLLSEYLNTKLNKLSKTYRITYSPMDPNMSNPAEFTKYVLELHKKVIAEISSLDITIR